TSAGQSSRTALGPGVRVWLAAVPGARAGRYEHLSAVLRRRCANRDAHRAALPGSRTQGDGRDVLRTFSGVGQPGNAAPPDAGRLAARRTFSATGVPHRAASLG